MNAFSIAVWSLAPASRSLPPLKADVASTVMPSPWLPLDFGIDSTLFVVATRNTC